MIKNSLAYNGELQPKHELQITEGNLNAARYSFSRADIENFQSVLSHYSVSSFMDTEWTVEIASSRLKSILSFPSGMPDTDGTILRALVLDYLRSYATTASCKRIIHEKEIYHFLFAALS